jgi:ATP phosphoribosyltransferase regulatory subunit
MDLSGFIDLGPEALQRLDALKARAMSVFASYGYARIEPPIVEVADAVLELSGEDIRRRMYFFDDPDGRELCLRPDLTIPACHMLMRSGWTGDRVARLSYAGPVFRHESKTGRGRAHQFTQAGVECLGPLDTAVADAEVLALAIDAVTACGLTKPLVRLGDAGLVHFILSALPLSRANRTRLERGVAAPARGQGRDAPAVAKGLDKLPRDEANAFVAEMMQVAGIRPVGDRSLDEIVERLIESSVAEDEHDEASEAAVTFLAIEGKPDDALGEIEKFLKNWKLGGREKLEALARSLRLMDRLGVDTARVSFAAGLKRHIDYYTGLVFEIASTKGPGRDVVCGGGRYDRLISVLSPGFSAQAAGFAMSLEMIAVVLEGDRLFSAKLADEQVDAEIVASRGDFESAAEAAAALRRGGWRVRLAGSEKTGDARYLIESNGAKGVVILEPREKRRVSLKISELTAFAEAHPCS